ncbi:tetratricopeptide repeat protein [Psychrobacter sp. AOP7-B1-24]|uniref:tetratricopeptide repeat protein n=1 Tax=Psychrobacter sp. AOP7-B1-24 TaxID=3457645 RepID=UPI00402B142C
MPLFKIPFISKVPLLLVAAMFSVSAMALDFNQVQRLANQGNGFAHFILGSMYETGEGVRQDYSKAAQWFEKAAYQEHRIAQFRLGMMYYEGKGVRQNTATAKEWFGIACDNGEQASCDSYRMLNQR